MESSLEGSVCGIDEAGRGPLAGPVYAAAVLIPNSIENIEGLHDSKKLSAAKRELLYVSIMEHCDIGVGIASTEEIDQLNILQATMLAMQRAYHSLPTPTQHALIDGKHCPTLPCSAYPIVKGDSTSASIAAASIIAKTLRDRAMEALDYLYPVYGFSRHAGYGTVKHKEAMMQYGVISQHRHSFRPVRECYEHIKTANNVTHAS